MKYAQGNNVGSLISPDYLEKLKARVEKARGSKVDFEFQEIGLKMAQFFPKKQHRWMWSLFYKFHEKRLLAAYEICKKRGVADVKYLIGVAKKLNLPY